MGTSESPPLLFDMTIHYLKNYVRYLFCSRHWRGYGIHSPFVFELVTRVIEEKLPYYKYGLVEKVRKIYQTSSKSLFLDGEEVKVSRLAKRLSMDPSHAQVMFRLVNKFKPRNVVETGMGMGITTMYLAAPDAKLNVVTIERRKVLAEFASSYIRKAGFRNVKVEEGDPLERLSKVMGGMEELDFLYMGDCLEGKDVEARLRICMPKMSCRSVLVVCGIYENESMTEAWRHIQAMEKVRVTLDLFKYGIVIFDGRLQKEDYYLRYFPDFHI